LAGVFCAVLLNKRACTVAKSAKHFTLWIEKRKKGGSKSERWMDAFSRGSLRDLMFINACENQAEIVHIAINGWFSYLVRAAVSIVDGRLLDCEIFRGSKAFHNRLPAANIVRCACK
jgi:hypothetical protein